MEDDRDRQKRAREETWALPLPSSVTSSGSFRILTKEQEREMEMEEFEAAWKATTTGLFPEDHAVMRHYQCVFLIPLLSCMYLTRISTRQRYLDAMAEKKPL